MLTRVHDGVAEVVIRPKRKTEQVTALKSCFPRAFEIVTT